MTEEPKVALELHMPTIGVCITIKTESVSYAGEVVVLLVDWLSTMITGAKGDTPQSRDAATASGASPAALATER